MGSQLLRSLVDKRSQSHIVVWFISPYIKLLKSFVDKRFQWHIAVGSSKHEAWKVQQAGHGQANGMKDCDSSNCLCFYVRFFSSRNKWDPLNWPMLWYSIYMISNYSDYSGVCLLIISQQNLASWYMQCCDVFFNFKSCFYL